MMINPQRSYSFKPHAQTFFCPLCGTQRVQRMRARLTALNHLQILLLTGFVTLLGFSWMQWRGALSYFVIWGLLEGGRRLLFKREVPCPHCGFDATWYKRDVKVARQKVQEFWASREAEKARNSVATSV
jgi:predicted RNA-binding Zn-ribbon protein involved in translation (DUF1610 family)